jgi:hypothetical protein
MGRRTSGQTVGLQTIGNLQASANTLTTTQANQDLTIDPNGTGGVFVNGDITISNQSDLRLSEASGNGTNYVAMQAASSMSANYTITWPAAVAATNGFVLTSDTSGNLAWTAIPATGVTASDPGSTATVHYPLFETSTGSIPTGALTTAKVRSNLSFVPSTGVMSTGGLSLANNTVSNSTTSGALIVTGGVGIGGTMTAASIVETSSITLKENISPIQNALDNILKLTGVVYDRKDTHEHEAGLIAEWVNEVLPDLVSKDLDGKAVGIKYTKLSAYLIECIKSLKQEIDELKTNKGA